MKKVLYGLLYTGPLFCQGIQNGHLSGNFQSNSQLYYEDVDLGITSENLPSEKFLINSFANLYTLQVILAQECAMKPTTMYC